MLNIHICLIVDVFGFLAFKNSIINIEKLKNKTQQTWCISIVYIYRVNKPQRKPKGQPIMDNPETLATLGAQNTGGRQKQQTYKTKNPKKTKNQKSKQRQQQHRKLKR